MPSVPRTPLALHKTKHKDRYSAKVDVKLHRESNYLTGTRQTARCSGALPISTLQLNKKEMPEADEFFLLGVQQLCSCIPSQYTGRAQASRQVQCVVPCAGEGRSEFTLHATVGVFHLL